MSRTSLAVLLTAAAFLTACRPANPSGPIDAATAACVPPGAVALAGFDLERLRASPLYPKLPRAIQSFVEPFRDARTLLAAYSGKEILLIARGSFTAPPAGATLLAPGLALAGPAESIAAAKARRVTGAPELLTYAQAAAAGNAIWIVTLGNVALPLTGNAANVNRLLRDMEFAALSVRLQPGIDFALNARGRSPEAARHFEETLRASLTMAAVGEAKNSQLTALLHSIQLHRDGREVRSQLSVDTNAAQHLIETLVPQ